MSSAPDATAPPLHDRSLLGLGLTLVVTLVVGLGCSALRLPDLVGGSVTAVAGAAPGVIGYQIWATRRKKAGESTKNSRPIGYLLAIALGGLLLIDTVLGALAGMVAGVSPAAGAVASTIVVVVMLVIVFWASWRLARSLGRFAVLWTIAIVIVTFILRCIILFGFMSAYVTSIFGPGWEGPVLANLVFSWALVLLAATAGSGIGWFRARRGVAAVSEPGSSIAPPAGTAPAGTAPAAAPPDPLDRRLH